jgi:hypothetical protein
MDVEFFAAVLRTGTVLGLDEQLGPEVIRRAVGPPLRAELLGDDLRWDYDVVSFEWEGRPDVLPYRGKWFTVPVAELAPGLRLDDLRAAAGMSFTEFREPQDGVQRYWQRESEMDLTVEVKTGAVLMIQSAFNRAFHVLHRYEHLAGELWQTLIPDMRDDWFAGNEPAGAGRAGWWLYLCTTISAKSWMVYDLRRRAEWLDYAVWAWEAAVARGHVTRATAVQNLAEDYAEAETFDLSLVPPSRDALVAECLSYVTGTMSRTDKNFVDLAALHRHGIEDPAVRAEFDRWYALRTDVPRVRLPSA